MNRCQLFVRSYFLDRGDSDEEEGFLKYLPDGFAEDDSGLQILIANNSVLFVVLLDFDCDFVDEISDLVDG